MRGDEKVSDLFFLVPLVFLQKLISNETDAYMKIELLIWNFAVTSDSSAEEYSAQSRILKLIAISQSNNHVPP